MNTKTKVSKPQHVGFKQGFRNYFRFDSYKAILRKEIIGGLSTFLAMCYILAVNPGIVGNAPLLDGSGATAFGLQGGLFLTTAIASFLGTLVMGLWARVPIAVAPGMGLNAFFAYNVASSVGFQSALTVTIISGIFYFILVMTPAREKISQLIPHNFKIAIGVGIGLFIAYLGLQNSGIVITDEHSPLVSGLGNFGNPLVITALCLTALGLILHFGKVPGGLIITMIVGAVIVIILCTTGAVTPRGFGPGGAGTGEALPHYGLLGSYSDYGSFVDVAKAGWLGFGNVEMWKNPMTYVGVLSFLYMDFFDTTGSLIVINKMVDFDKCDKKWFAKANQVDALSTICGAGIGSTTVTTFVESTVGVGSGAKTGFSAVITSLCFALSIAIWPIIQVFMPINGLQPITSPVLIIIGAVMVSQIKEFEWEIFADIPMLFVTMIVMLLSNSIAHGLSFGMITFVLMNGSLGLIQKIKHKKKVVNSMTIPINDGDDKVQVREFNYLKRINWVCLSIAIISVIFIILEQGNTWGNWF